MRDNPISKNTPLNPEEEKAKAAILAECDKLAAAGVTFVAVHFDGYGDSGATEDVRCYDSESYGSEEHQPVKYDASHYKNTSRFWFRSDTRTTAAVLEMSF